MPRLRDFLFLAVALATCGGAATVATACNSANCTCHEITRSRQRGCWLAASGSFQVCSFNGTKEAEEVAQRCEKLRASLADVYGLDSGNDKWQPRCQIFLFQNKQKYGAVVGRAAMESLGSSLVTPDTGVVKSRRIDLRTDVKNYLEEVLPHELTHVLIADHFREGPPPLWYDEGLALLADSKTKQTLHLRDLRNGMSRGSAFSLQDLLTANQYPSADRVSVFYGQCASVARCLSNHAGTQKVHEFVRRSQEVGANLALQETYGIAGVTELETLWRKNLTSPAPIIPARFSPSQNSD
jgi:hypothetical protein